MDTIKATKNGVSKNFTSYAWELLGKNKNGWKVIPTEAQRKSSGEATEKAKESQDLNPKIPRSSDEGVNVDSAMKTIKEMKTIEEVKNYVEGELRVTVIRAGEKRINELK